MANILLVDDTPDFCITLSGVLTDAGHTVQTAASEGEALTAISKANFDFALIDVRLHDGGEEDESGITLTWALRALRPDLRVILLTRYIRSKQMMQALQFYGVMDFIDKNNPDYATLALKTLGDANQPQSAHWHETTHLSLSLIHI